MADMSNFRFGQAKNPDGSVDWANSMETQDGKINWAKLAPTIGKNFEQKAPDYAGNEGVDPALIDAYTAQRNAEQKPFTDALAKFNAGGSSVTTDQLQQLYDGVGSKSGAMATQIEQARQEAFKNKMEAGNGFWDTMMLAAKGAAVMAGGIELLGGGGVAGVGAHTGMAAGETATGGSVVGSGGLLGSTGSGIADAALNGAAKGVLTSTITGGDPIKGALSGGIAGGFSDFLPKAVTDMDKVTRAAEIGAVGGGINAALNGGDVVKGITGGGVGGGFGTFIANQTGDLGKINSGALAGAAGAGASAAVTGGDVINSALRGGVVGGVGNAVTDSTSGLLGKSGSEFAGSLAGSVAGTLVPTPSNVNPNSNPTTVTNTANDVGLSFGNMLPQYAPINRANIDWTVNRLPGH